MAGVQTAELAKALPIVNIRLAIPEFPLQTGLSKREKPLLTPTGQRQNRPAGLSPDWKQNPPTTNDQNSARSAVRCLRLQKAARLNAVFPAVFYSSTNCALAAARRVFAAQTCPPFCACPKQ